MRAGCLWAVAFFDTSGSGRGGVRGESVWVGACLVTAAPAGIGRVAARPSAKAAPVSRVAALRWRLRRSRCLVRTGLSSTGYASNIAAPVPCRSVPIDADRCRSMPIHADRRQIHADSTSARQRRSHRRRTIFRSPACDTCGGLWWKIRGSCTQLAIGSSQQCIHGRHPRPFGQVGRPPVGVLAEAEWTGRAGMTQNWHS